MKTFLILMLTLSAIAAVTYFSSKAKFDVESRSAEETPLSEEQVMGGAQQDPTNTEKIPTH